MKAKLLWGLLWVVFGVAALAALAFWGGMPRTPGAGTYAVVLAGRNAAIPAGQPGGPVDEAFYAWRINTETGTLDLCFGYALRSVSCAASTQ